MKSEMILRDILSDSIQDKEETSKRSCFSYEDFLVSKEIEFVAACVCFSSHPTTVTALIAVL